MSLELDTVYCGDCLEIMKEISDKSIDLIFTDPPYGHNNNNGDLISRWEAALGKAAYVPARDNRPIANDGIEANALFQEFLKEANRVLRPGSAICCCCSGGGPDPQFARWSIWIDEIFDFKQMIVWDKGPMGMGWHYRRSYETVLVAHKKNGKVYWFDDSNKVENVIRPSKVKKIIPTADQHPTQKPVELAELFIQYHSLPGMVVLDPFCGSGTTAVAAKRLGRHFIGIELSPEYCEIARKRVAAVPRRLDSFFPRQPEEDARP